MAAALKAARRGSLTLTGLHVEEGLGVPIVGSACAFKVDGTTEVSVYGPGGGPKAPSSSPKRTWA